MDLKNISTASEYKIVDDTALVAQALDDISQIPGLRGLPPRLYIDLEGVDLGRTGSVSLIQIHTLPSKMTYIFDVYKLGRQAFETPNRQGVTLKSLLTDSSIPKAIFDCRTDNDALYNLYNVDLDGVQDIQLMEIVARANEKKQYLKGLNKTVLDHAGFGLAEKREWTMHKDYGKELFASKTYAALEQRPLPDQLVAYCIQDVSVLPRLWEKFNQVITFNRASHWKTKISQEIYNRLRLARAKDWVGNNPDFMTKAPAGWWKTTYSNRSHWDDFDDFEYGYESEDLGYVDSPGDDLYDSYDDFGYGHDW